MAKMLFVGNLPFDADETAVRGLFESYGEVQSVSLLTQSKTGESRGICFVEMEEKGAEAAITGLNGREFGGRDLRVRYVQEEDGIDTSSMI